MAQVTISINSREYSVGAEDGQEANILRLAAILDEKARTITAASGQINESMLLSMVGLLVADELCELKKGGKQDNSAAVDNAALKQQDKELAEKIQNITNKINSIVKSL